jgi:hypothetical protein
VVSEIDRCGFRRRWHVSGRSRITSRDDVGVYITDIGSAHASPDRNTQEKNPDRDDD